MKWEYLSTWTTFRELEGVLETHGRDGWELVSAMHITTNDSGEKTSFPYVELIFKRPVNPNLQDINRAMLYR